MLEELEDFINKADNKWIKERRIYLRNQILALLCCGARANEFMSINFQQLHDLKIINDDSHGIHWATFKIVGEKNKKIRDVFLPLVLVEYFKNQRPFIKNEYNNFTKNLLSFTKMHKIPFYLTAHTLRRTFASNAQDKGFNSEQISTILGNSPEVCLKKYMKSTRVSFNTAVNGSDQAINFITSKLAIAKN
jgi:integrase